MDSEFAAAYNNRGYAYSQLKRYDEAVSDFEKSIELNPQYENPYKHYGVLCKEEGDFAKACELLTKAIELNPKYKEAYEARAEVYRLLGENAKAEADEKVAKGL